MCCFKKCNVESKSFLKLRLPHLECKSKTEEPENIRQNLQNQKQYEGSNIQCKMKHIFFQVLTIERNSHIVKNQFHLVGSKVKLFSFSCSLLVQSPLTCFYARILCLFFFPHQVILLKKGVTKGNTHFFLWGQGFGPQWHNKIINFCVSASLLLVSLSNPKMWDITETTSLQYLPLYAVLDCAANYVVISVILGIVIFITGLKKPKKILQRTVQREHSCTQPPDFLCPSYWN